MRPIREIAEEVLWPRFATLGNDFIHTDIAMDYAEELAARVLAESIADKIDYDAARAQTSGNSGWPADVTRHADGPAS